MKLIGPSLFIENENCLVLGDLHIGSDTRLSSSGALSPILGLTEIKETITSILEKISNKNKNQKIKKIILLGDICNNFGYPNYSETKGIVELFKFLKNITNKIILIKGNHDQFIENILKELDIKQVNELIINKILFCHGDKIINANTEIETIIIGHEHPAISINNGIRTEKFKCFIKSKYEKSDLWVLPSLNKLTIGTDILKEKLISPYITDKALKKSKIYIVEEMQVYDFGLLNNLKTK